MRSLYKSYERDRNPDALCRDYPFGLRVPLTTGDNKYLYNGKELVDKHDLNWYHYGAR
ncbi:MAG: hypothetical protein HY961_18845 [Ignavibacteriae bacterium]|nr:hypothetical protein [Ignavibacteriota bacterium]